MVKLQSAIAAFMMVIMPGKALSQNARLSNDTVNSDCAPRLPYRTNCLVSAPPRFERHNSRRTALELGAVYGGAAIMYFADGRARQIDRNVLQGLTKIFSPHRIRFDDNRFDLNNISHPLGGLVYYGIPRANGASATRSFLTLLFASAFWEQVVELQEIASINDHVGTPISGWTLGESLFQARMFFRRAAPTTAHRVMDNASTGPVILSELLWPRARPLPAGSLTDSGRPADMDGAVRIYAGLSDRDAPTLLPAGTHIEIGVETEFQNTGQRQVPGDRAQWVRGSAATEFDFHLSFQRGDLNELHTRARVIPIAWYRHRMNATAETVSGFTLLTGPAAEFELDMLGDAGRTYVQRLAAYMLGGSLDLHLNKSAIRGRGKLDVFVNFAQVAATGRLGNPGEVHPNESTLFRAERYYNALGPTVTAHAAFGWRAFEIQGDLRQHRLRSIEHTALDRNPEIATNIRPKGDHWSTIGSALVVRLRPNVELSVRHQRRSWTGYISDFHVEKIERAWWTRLDVAL